MLSNSDSLLSSSAVKNEIDGYEKLFEGARKTTGKITTNESIEHRRKEYKKMVDAFYNLVTDFYTFGWVRLHHISIYTFTERIPYAHSYKTHQVYTHHLYSFSANLFILPPAGLMRHLWKVLNVSSIICAQSLA